MAFLELAQKRYSVRRYQDRPVERVVLEQCLEAAHLAPSASNSQPWFFVVVDDPSLKDAVARTTFNAVISFNRFTVQAPVIVAVLRRDRPIQRVAGAFRGIDYSQIDVGCATEHFCLQAAELGLGTCILGWFGQTAIRRLLSIPRGWSVALLITVGYPADSLREKRRKPLGELFTYNKGPRR